MSAGNYKLFIFDFDLTLADTREVAKIAYKAALEASGGFFDERKITEYLSKSLKANYEGIDNPQITFDEFAQKYYQVNKTVLNKVIFYDDAPVTIREIIQDSNNRVAIVSNRDRESLLTMIGYNNELKTYFTSENIFGKEDTSKQKPNPEPILNCLEKMNMAVAEAIYIGAFV